MEVLNLSFLVLLLYECYHSTEAMGLCAFAEKFPCEESGGSECFTSPGCKSQIPNDKIKPSRATTSQVTTDQATSGTTTIDLVSTGHTTPDQVITTTTLCPPHMVYANCTSCQGSCQDPKGCVTNCTEYETCVCPDRFLFKGNDCVPEAECGCFIEGQGVIPEREFHISSNCSMRCNCSAGQLVCDDDYQCSVNAVCGEQDNLRQCYCSKGYVGDGVNCTPTSALTDCLEVFNSGGTESGVYNITPATWNGLPFEVYCNMTDGGGWTVFQRRVNGTVNFDLDWNSFRDGFGFPDHELWLGNEKIFSLTNQKRYQLRIDFVDRDGDHFFAKYGFFRINNETNNYRLTVQNYMEGDAGDSLTAYQNNEEFSTRDRDNGDYSTYNIANLSERGAWWYGGYHNHNNDSDLNGDYKDGHIYWYTLPGNYLDIKFTEMKVRPA